MAVEATSASPANPKRSRYFWLHIHPLLFGDVMNELQKAISQFLDRPRSSTEEIRIEIADLRGQINSFEIMGPTSSQVLKGALTPVMKDDRGDFKKVCSHGMNRVETS